MITRTVKQNAVITIRKVRFESLGLHFIKTFSESTSHFISVCRMKLIRSALHRATPEGSLTYSLGYPMMVSERSEGEFVETFSKFRPLISDQSSR